MCFSPSGIKTGGFQTGQCFVVVAFELIMTLYYGMMHDSMITLRIMLLDIP